MEWKIKRLINNENNCRLQAYTLLSQKKKVTHSKTVRPPLALIISRVCHDMIFNELLQCHNIYLRPDLHYISETDHLFSR